MGTYYPLIITHFYPIPLSKKPFQSPNWNFERAFYNHFISIT